MCVEGGISSRIRSRLADSHLALLLAHVLLCQSATQRWKTKSTTNNLLTLGLLCDDIHFLSLKTLWR